MGFSPDGQLLASWSTASGATSEATLWVAGTARRLRGHSGITGYVVSAGFVDDRRGLVVLEHDLNDDASKNRLVSGTSLAVPECLSPAATDDPLLKGSLLAGRGLAGDWIDAW